MATIETLKKAMSETSILAMPNFSKNFVLEIDASDLAIGSILM